jgi:hypothetical protein
MGVFLFILGLMLGGLFGITILCMCQINRDEERNL